MEALGRQISVTAPDTGTTKQTWNDLGQFTPVTDAANHTISYAYDDAVGPVLLAACGRPDRGSFSPRSWSRQKL